MSGGGVPVDVAVLGGGPAGRAAAEELRLAGASHLVLDEPWPRDLVHWGAPAGTRVWGLWRDEGGFVLAGLRAAGPLRISARALIVCAGATSLPGGRYVPVTEPTRLLWAAHRFDPISAAWLPDIDPSGRTTVAHLYAAGACADPGGDAALQGRRAARAALDDFVMPVGARPVAALDDTILCACEGVTTAMARAAMAAGAGDPNQVKAFTRAGMGTCQGRLCGDALGRLFAAPPPLTARLPLRPVPMEAVLGRFTYADIPVPVAAPI